MSAFVSLLICPNQRLRHIQPAVGGLSVDVMRLYGLDLSGLRWAECRQGVLARFEGNCCPEMLARIPSAKLECTVMHLWYREDGWGFRLCFKGSVEDTLEGVSATGPLPPSVTPEQHAARLARRFKAAREPLAACLTPGTQEESGQERLGQLLRVLAPWAQELLVSGQLAPARPAPAPDNSSPKENTPSLEPAQRPPEKAPGPEACLPFLTGVKALRRGWSFPLSLLYKLLPQKRPVPETVSHQDWTARELKDILDQFCSGGLDRLELDFAVPGEGTYVRRLGKAVGQICRLTLVLIREKGRCMCLLLDGQVSGVYYLIADRNTYMTVDVHDLKKTIFHGQEVEAYTVFDQPRPDAIRREAELLLSRLDCRDGVLSVTGRMGVWSRQVPMTNTQTAKRIHQELRDRWTMK